jgi:hypothetical protein
MTYQRQHRSRRRRFHRRIIIAVGQLPFPFLLLVLFFVLFIIFFVVVFVAALLIGGHRILLASSGTETDGILLGSASTRGRGQASELAAPVRERRTISRHTSISIIGLDDKL